MSLAPRSTIASEERSSASQSDDRQTLIALLGANTVHSRFADVTEDAVNSDTNWHERRFTFTSQTGETFAGLGLFPRDAQESLPALLYCHAHGFNYALGCEELLAPSAAFAGPIAPDIAQSCRSRGLPCPAILAIDMPGFGSRQTPGEDTRAKAHAWYGTTLFGEMLSDLMSAVTFLSERPDIDAGRLGTYGFSMGSTHAFWLAAIDERIKAAVALCSFADLASLIDEGTHNGHGHYMTVPSLLQTFSTGRIAGLAAPRALFIGAGMQDWSTPAAAFEKARLDLQTAYSAHPEKIAFHIEPNTGHQETKAMRKAALAFLEQHLWH